MERTGFRWIGLTRVSTVGQAEDGGGLDTQKAVITKWVKDRDERLVAVLEDAGVSGTLDALGQRLALAKATHMLNLNEADGIVVAKLDRLGRELSVQEIILHKIGKLGCVLASCDAAEQEALVGDHDPARRMFRQMLAVFADFERNMIAARTQAGKQRKSAEVKARLANGGTLAGGWVGNPWAPYGYEMDGEKGLREVPYEINAIAVARTMRARKATYSQIGEYLAGCGVRLRKGKMWHPQVVKQVLYRASVGDYPAPQTLDALAKTIMDLPVDAMAR
jgi:DNA invertase Pin-like site-specific DNA recombinase